LPARIFISTTVHQDCIETVIVADISKKVDLLQFYNFRKRIDTCFSGPKDGLIGPGLSGFVSVNHQNRFKARFSSVLFQVGMPVIEEFRNFFARELGKRANSTVNSSPVDGQWSGLVNSTLSGGSRRPMGILEIGL